MNKKDDIVQILFRTTTDNKKKFMRSVALRDETCQNVLNKFIENYIRETKYMLDHSKIEI